MIPQSRSVKLAAVLIAGGLHVALAATLTGPEPIEVDGVGGSGEVRLGTSFQDLVQGMMTAATAPIRHQHEASQKPVMPVETTDALPVLQPTVSNAVKAAETDSQVMPQRSGPPTSETVSVTPVLKSLPAATLQPVVPMSSASPRETRSTNAAETTALKAQTPAQTVAASENTAAAPIQTPPPVRRPERAAPQTTTDIQKPAASGNATSNASAGVAEGRETAKAVTSGGAGRQQASGNAAQTNYPGQVMRCISSAARINRNRGGTAVVTFRIGSTGRITNVGLASSSGDARHDRAATQAIRRAGPCPRPPQGAQTQFSVRIR